MRGFSLLIVMSILIAGCASSGPTGKEILTGSIAPQKSRLVIYRTSPLGFAVQPNYLVDGKPVGPSQPNGFVVCNLEPGTHKVGVDNISLNINFGGGTDKATVQLRPGHTTYLKAEPQMGLTLGVITLSQVVESQGAADAASLHKIESTCT